MVKKKKEKKEGQFTLKYRPKSWKTFIGNEDVVEAIQTNLNKENIPKAIMFTGPSGIGKTTAARIIRRALKVSEQDYHEYDIASVRGIDNIRQIINESQYKPLASHYKIYVLDEFHKASADAKECALKWLEDSPPHVIIIIATTNPSQIINTIHTRCAVFEFKSAPKPKIKKLISMILKREQKELDEEVLKVIVENSNGSPRQALSILDTVIDIEDKDKALAIAERNQFSEASVLEICQGLVNNTTWKLMAMNLSKLDDDADYEYIRYAVLKYMQKVLLNPKSKADPDRICEIITLFSEPFFYSKKAGLVSSCYLALKL